MMNSGPRLKWLNRYGSKESEFRWRTLPEQSNTVFHRPLGLVETLFDIDGRMFEGRADLSAMVTLKISTRYKVDKIRSKICNAWAVLRIQHALLRSKVLPARDFCDEISTMPNIRHFVVEKPVNSNQVDKEAVDTICFLEDYYTSVDAEEFWRHTQNTGRVIEPSVSMSKLFVLPITKTENHANMYDLHLLLIMGHEICDGLTLYNWISTMIELLNNETEWRDTSSLITDHSIISSLPLAQETLYPPISGSTARQRWFWVLTIILRHVRRPLPAAFSNPLRRSVPRPSGSAVPMPPTYEAVLNYNFASIPPLNSFHISVELSQRATQKHHRLCREAGASIGAGSFALAAMVMMELEELRNPHVPEAHRQPFIAPFPLDPRAMFAYKAPPNSLMLAFSDGIVLPFLPSRLPLERRFRFLARIAHRQLRVYQKRVQKTRVQQARMDTTRVLASNYIMTVERTEMLLRDELGPGEVPQGNYTVMPNLGRATHGVSSVGSYKFPSVVAGASLSSNIRDTAEFIAEFVSLRHGVRARDDEFLVGMGGDQDLLWAQVSFDGNAIDEDLVQVWKEKMENLFEFREPSRL